MYMYLLTTKSIRFLAFHRSIHIRLPSIKQITQFYFVTTLLKTRFDSCICIHPQNNCNKQSRYILRKKNRIWCWKPFFFYIMLTNWAVSFCFYPDWVYSCITLATLCTIWAVGICSYPDLSVFLHYISYFVYNLSCWYLFLIWQLVLLC